MYENVLETENKFKYNGIEEQDDFGLNTFMAEFRMFEPTIGRWWQHDPIIKEAMSPYAWVTNNPLLFSDPLGLDSVKYDDLDDIPFDPENDVVILPEIVIEEDKSFPEDPINTRIGDKVLPPRDGVWWVNLFRENREYGYWSVDNQGYVVGLKPITGVAPAPNIGKIGNAYKSIKALKGIGTGGNYSKIRIVQGGKTKAMEIWRKLTRKAVKIEKGKVVGQEFATFKDGSKWGFRHSVENKPPTIDLPNKYKKIIGIERIKFE